MNAYSLRNGILHRTGMYLGSVADGRALQLLLSIPLSFAVEQFREGKCREVSLTMRAHHAFTVTMDGADEDALIGSLHADFGSSLKQGDAVFWEESGLGLLVAASRSFTLSLRREEWFFDEGVLRSRCTKENLSTARSHRVGYTPR